jgi:hypothetical protein
MQNKPISTKLVVIILSLALISLGLLSVVYVKKLKKDFITMRTALLKDNQFLRNQAELLQDSVNQKNEAISQLEAQKKAAEEEANSLKDASEKIRIEYSGKIDNLEKKKSALRKRIFMLEKAPLADRIKAAMQGETDKKIVNVLQDTLDKLDAVKSGKAVTLEPIEVAQADKKGVVLSVDPKNVLIVVSIGSKDGLMEGDRCKIFSKEGKEVATAEVISSRYTMSACFVDDINYGFNIKSLKQGYSVIMADRK